METSNGKILNIISPEVQLWVALRRHWMVSAITASLVFGVIAYKTLREPGIYKSEALIVVANQVGIPIVQDPATQNLVENLPTEIEILQSPTLLNRAIKKFDTTYNDIPVWQIQGNLSLRQPEDTNVLSVSYQDTDGVRAKAILDQIVATYIEYSEESRRSPVTNAIRFIEKRLPDAQKTLEKTSSALTSFRTQHNLDNPDSNVSLAYAEKEAIEKEIDVAEIELNQLKKREQELKRQMEELGQNPTTAIPDAALSQDPNYQALLEQLNNIELQYKLEQSRYTSEHPIVQELKDRRDQLRQLLKDESKQQFRGKASSSSLKKIENGAIQQDLASQLLQTQINSSVQEKRLSDIHQQRVKANLELQRMLRLQQDYKELERQYQFQAKMVDDFLAKLQELRVQEAQDTISWKVIEPPTLPTVPIARSRTRGLVLGGITGILAAFGVAFFLEKIDSRLKDIKTIQDVTQLPILGVIPQFHTALSLGLGSDSFTEAIRSLALTLSFQNSPTSGKIIAVTSATTGEGKTTLTYNLGLALTELGKKVLIVDGNFSNPRLHEVFSLPNSQGLTTAIATDRSWAEIVQSFSGKTVQKEKVVNQVNSQQELTFLSGINPIKPSNGKGNGQKITHDTSSIFAKVSPADLLRADTPLSVSSVEKYPDVLTSGPVGTNSFAWLVAPKMVELLDKLRKNYDYVLFDTSSLTELADTQSLTPKVDEVILVISQNRVETSLVTEALKILQRNNSPIRGVVVNTVGRGKGKQLEQYFNPFS